MIDEKELKKVFTVFEKHYELVPLEVFGDDPYQTLISTVMSARTKDETTLVASQRLFKEAPNTKALAKLPVEKIEKLIFPVGFYKTKAKHLKALAQKLEEETHGKVPSEKTELMKLPGVGSKTANLVLNRAFGKPAIAVDTHVHKIANLLGWIDTKTPEESEKALHSVIPERYWTPMNRLFVSIGRQYTTQQRLRNFLKNEGLLTD